MDNELFINTEFPPPPEMTAAHFEPPSSSSAMLLNWALMDPNPHQDSSFLWEKSTEQQQQQQSIFDSALSSLVSSPTPSNSNFSGGCGGGGGGGGDGFIIRELIGKLGNINNNNSGEIYGTPMSRSASCYTTPMNSPPPPPPASANSQMMMNRTTPLTEFSADPGFAERAARFSCFGSRSFNGRTNSSLPINNNIVNSSGKLTRVSSTPALKALVSPENISTTKPMIPGGEFSRKRKTLSKGKSKENLISTASPSPSFSKTAEKKENWDGKGSKSIEEKGGKRRREEEDEEEEEEGEGEGNKNNNTKPPEPPKDYIHVRARRGQATDSHSLAERVRREKIGERMKLLQDLVPGCNKVTGKALMLDEIINYVQSLQRQVEFLSMKLSSVNDTRLDFNVDALVSKDVMIPLSNNQLHEEVLQSKSLSHHHHHQQQQQQFNNYNNNNNLHLHPNISSNNMMLQSPMNSLETSTLARSFTHLPTLTQFTDSISQYQMFSEEDLQSIVGMGVAQNPNHESQHMKIEL